MSFSDFRRRVQLSLVTMFFVPIALAAPVPDELVIKPLPGARATHVEVLPNVDHAVATGVVRKVNNRLRAEQEVRATGDLIRVTFEVPNTYSRTEAFDHAKAQLLTRPHSMLYFCEGRECGASSLWANEILDNARLYGPEENQAYLAVSLNGEPQRLVSLYAITRGNRRVYLHVDQFTPDEPIREPLYPTPSTLLKVLHANDRLALPGLDLDGGADGAASDATATTRPAGGDPEVWLNLVNRMLRSDTRLRVAISGEHAPAVMQRLIDLGIRSSRLEIGAPFPEAGVILDKL